MAMKLVALLNGCVLLTALALLGCTGEEPVAKQDPAPKAAKTPAKKINVGKNVALEIGSGDERRVVVEAEVCLRQGMLEQFLTRKRTKEHEAILVADVDARNIHTALTLAKAEPGSPVKFQPQYQPAKGTVVKVFLEYEDADKKKQRVAAQEWIRSVKTKKTLEHDWVFAGSVLIQDPFEKEKPPFYAANDGTVICVSNFESAMLDLPIMSTQLNDDLFFEAFTDRIPPLETRVQVIFEPVLKKEKK